MEIVNSTVVLAHDKDSQVDDAVKRGVIYGLRVKVWQGGTHTDEEAALMAKLDPSESNGNRPELALALDECGLAYGALCQYRKFLIQTDSWSDFDRVAWGTIPLFERMLRDHGVAVVEQ